MMFINPKTDLAFKKIFGSEQSKDSLISFLNAILYNSQQVIEDILIIEPYIFPKIRGIKDTFLDVKAKIKGGENTIIKVQVLNVEGFEKSILYHVAKNHSIQLGVGEKPLLNPIIALTITDFEMFPHLDKIITKFAVKEIDYLVDYLVDDLELVFVELPKFNKSLEQLETMTDKWLYFLKEAKCLEKMPANMENIPEITKAFQMANRAKLTKEELEEQERREIDIQDQRYAISKALEEGKQEGIEETKIKIAKNLLKFLDEETVSQNTGLTVEEVKQLKQLES